MRTHSRTGRFAPAAALAALSLLVAVGCAPSQTDETPTEDTTAAAPAMPDTTADALWAHVESESYKNWPMWPGKEAFYQGTDPHGALLTTHVNPLALDAITNKAGTLPPGAIVVKENYSPERELAAVTVMYKKAGYDAEHNDWFWMKRLADGTVEAQGRVDMCISCHGAQSQNDYLMTGSIR